MTMHHFHTKLDKFIFPSLPTSVQRACRECSGHKLHIPVPITSTNIYSQKQRCRTLRSKLFLLTRLHLPFARNILLSNRGPGSHTTTDA